MLESLLLILKEKEPEVEMGKMMSCDGLTYKGKVFCFEYKEKMIFKLSKGYDIEKHGITEYTFLNPFKNKGPMKAWFELTVDYEMHFEALAVIALEVMKHG